MLRRLSLPQDRLDQEQREKAEFQKGSKTSPGGKTKVERRNEAFGRPRSAGNVSTCDARWKQDEAHEPKCSHV